MILDTNGLSALGDGDPKLEPILREAEDLALPTLCWGNIDTESANRASACGTSDGWRSGFPIFGYWPSMRKRLGIMPKFDTLYAAAGARFRRTTRGSRLWRFSTRSP